jgi:malate synthase
MYALNVANAISEDRRTVGSLSVDPAFYYFVEYELLPSIKFDSVEFWRGLEDIICDLTPANRQLLSIRDEMQRQIDAWHKARQGDSWNHDEYVSFLREIGYLAEVTNHSKITTANVDDEIKTIAAPQLVVPVSNARFAINAANARWGSLYDALYGTDVIPQGDNGSAASGYDPERGNAVIAYATDFLDRIIPLDGASHADVVSYSVEIPTRYASCFAILLDGSKARLKDSSKFIGWSGWGVQRSYLFRDNDLHIELQTDPHHPVGKEAPGNLCDIILESAVTTIQDCEDSVSAVDAEDKVRVYRNWLGLMQGTLEATFRKNGKPQTRRLNSDRKYIARDGSQLVLSGRSLMLNRNVGHLLSTDTVTDGEGKEVFEGILDAVITTACALSDNRSANSRTGSIYIVKPKMHGPDEASFANTLFVRIEELFGLAPGTIKIGVMDEERRTTINLAQCIDAVKDRLVFINTGFLDRTGDEIRTSMHAGPVLPKEQIKTQPWIKAYEDWNVDIGIRSGLPGKAQIGKGMWSKPDNMREMMASKSEHPRSGANCAWVPSPTAATLHAMHYHDVSANEHQAKCSSRTLASLDDILTPPLCDAASLDEATIQSELDNNAQSILGYVVRWIDQGIGCSKVPDINNVGLMEDRATLRISSLHIANWLLHGICSERQVLETLRRMARVVDAQNKGDIAYSDMAPYFDSSLAFQAACDLVFKAIDQPNGYTELLLHKYRRRRKEQLAS